MLILLLYIEGFGVKVHTVNSPMLFLAIVEWCLGLSLERNLHRVS